ncbi:MULTISPECIES: PilN family type IVB pilus formation outer membrane protein [Pectobacterium]|uniref:Type IVB pilus formation outer membrane protein, R64 PilN family n=2 Tax=Pectobacterium TaxID=122277 RepID=A0A0H3I7W4_PECPM|nr:MULTISPECIES: PilN family type IVB pilus formation outer membrane protein [Pectobacterium]AFI91608.1 Type IVB pilus formation outer membrane protein, R64 PilN family [Pectobacterium parmentieri]RJL51122.1 PilN family type IVB pilus formation outer membrane protein [Pectobacterium carotovorum]UFT94953.1 PilN family type IVB pilus formation outer membrane protein [Pectobacterium carotovorum]
MSQFTPHFTYRNVALALLVSTVLNGCATKGFRDADEQAERDIRTAEQLHGLSRKQPSSPSLVWVDEPWVNPRPIRVSARAQQVKLPPCSLTLIIDGSLSLYEVGQRITRSCGFPVVITPDVMSALSGSVSQGGTGATRAIQGALPRPDEGGRPALGSIGGVTSTQSFSPNIGAGLITDISWEGEPLGGALDQITSRLGLNWKFENNQVVLYYLDTRTFRLKILNAETAMNSNLTGTSSSTAGGDNSSVSGSQNSGQSTSVKLESNVHNDIAKSVKSMISPSGTWHLSSSTGELVVTDVPQVLDRVDTYIDNLNVRMNKMVKLMVSVYSVQRKSASQTSLDLSVVASRLDRVGATLTGTPTAATAISSAGFNVLNGKFAGTKALFQALETQGNVSVVMEHEATTTNLVPTPFQIAGQMVYLRNQKTTVSENYATTDMEPGSITTGTQMTLLPDIRDEGDIQLRFHFSHSDPAQLRRESSEDGRTKMEMPYTTVRSLSEQFNLKPDQTLIVSGYNSRNLTTSREGAFDPDVTVAGGGKSSESDDVTLIIAVTPVLM